MALRAEQSERIKAELRIRFGSMRAFEAKRGLPDGSARDALRGRRSRRVEAAIAEVLELPVTDVFPLREAAAGQPDSSTNRDSNGSRVLAHRLSSDGR